MDLRDEDLITARQEYTRQGLDVLYGRSFEETLLPVREAAGTIARSDPPAWSGDPRADLLGALLSAGRLRRQYEKHGISRQIWEDTMEDVGRWARTYCETTGNVGLAETGWLSNHFSFRLFQLGRLQFCLEPAAFSSPEHGIKEKNPLISVHIPAGKPLDPAACDQSFALARAFFPRYFPDYPFPYFSCHSWLLDPGVIPLCGENSRIASFQKRFVIVAMTPSSAIARYVLRWNIRADEIADFPVKNDFQRRVKAALIQGHPFYEATGVLAR